MSVIATEKDSLLIVPVLFLAADYKIVKAVICAGLYPNVAKVVRVSKSTNYFK